MEKFFFVKFKKGSAEENMRMDEILFEEICVKRKASGFRIFGWKEKCITYGRNQKAPMFSVPAVRRPTGGGIVAHENDTAFSFFISSNSKLWAFNPMDVYMKIIGIIKNSLAKLGFDIRYAGGKKRKGSSYCFKEALPYELVLNGRKVVGCALARKREGILAQGTIMLDLNPLHLEEKVKDTLVSMKFHLFPFELNPQFTLNLSNISLP